jgi:FkbM family methyltransferase
MPVTATPRRYRLARRLARVVAVLAVWKRKAAVERLLRALFGDMVETGGRLLEVDRRDRAVGARLRRHGIWSPAETALCEQLLRPGMVALDVGANIGYFTVLFAQRVGPAGRVYAFEPEPYNFGLLQRNLERNRCAHVTTFQVAAGERAGRQRLYKSSDNLGDHRLGHGAAGREWVEVPVAALDEILAGAGRPVDFVKMDIQGAEPAALRGMHGLLGGHGPLALITEFWPWGIGALGEDPLGYLHMLRDIGFALAVIRPGKRPRLEPLADEAGLRALCARGGEVNLLCRRT